MNNKKSKNEIIEESIGKRKLNRFKSTFSHILKKGDLLDVGCGKGDWLKFLSERTKLSLMGVDASQINLNKANKNLIGKNIPIKITNAMNLPFPDNRFGQVTALEVLEHMPQWKIGLGEIIRVASKKVVITVPYNEKPICEICPNCKSISYLEGHINRFTDKDFKSIDIKGKITFHKIKYTSSFNYQIKWRGLLRSSNKISYLKNIKINTKIPKTVCPSCHKGAPYKKYAKRFIRRLIRTLTNSPEYLLVSIDLTD